MDLFNLPPLDMNVVPLRRDQQPSPKMLLGIALAAVVGLALSWSPGHTRADATLAKLQTVHTTAPLR